MLQENKHKIANELSSKTIKSEDNRKNVLNGWHTHIHTTNKTKKQHIT